MNRTRYNADVGHRAYKKNYLINGDFSVWQRGTDLANVANLQYCEDRWVVRIADMTPNVSISRAEAIGIGGVTSKYISSTRIVTADSTALIDKIHRIEGVHTLAGKKASLSFKGNITNGVVLECYVVQNFGDGGSTEVVLSSIEPFVPATNGWDNYKFTFDIPSISGKTVGANDFIYIILRVLSPPDDTYVQLGDVQLESGSTATPFEYVSPQQNLAECQRYYQEYGAMYPNSRTGELDSTARLSQNLLPVYMRTIPSITLVNPLGWAVPPSTIVSESEVVIFGDAAIGSSVVTVDSFTLDAEL